MRRWLWLTMLATCGCSQRTGVVLTVDGDAIVADQLRLTAIYDNAQMTRTIPESAGTPIGFPTDLFAEFDARPMTVTFNVQALSAGGMIASADVPPFAIVPGQIDRLEVQLQGIYKMPPSGPPATMPDGGAPPHLTYAAAVMADGPIAYYRLDETSGTVALDSSGHGLHGSYGPRVTHSAAGLLTGDSNGAASFSGGNWTRDGLILVPASSLLQPSRAVTVELWVQQSALNPDGAILIDYGDPGPQVPEDPAYGLLIYKSAFNAFLWTDVSSAGPGYGTGTQPGVGQPYHVVETFDGMSVRVYVNGLLETTIPVTGTLYFAASNGGLGIGGTTIGTNTDLVFAGTLDEVAIYGTALSAAQVAKHYAAGTGH
jgi:hypothetical protein